MAKHILRLEEFENAGIWQCAALQDLTKVWNKWYTLPFALKMNAYDFVEMLITQFHPDHVHLGEGPFGSVLVYSWKNKEDMRKFKNWINAQLRKIQFYVE